ncbi:glycine--tRNA ligase subunit beta [Glacieibacterium frigidum]|uniref:Glycine--tRNA ligase beta subunit n=1 Tax=Glacieibacterium frigidum TaxID=2593303 RepID=A0A552UJD5_9SPHN|nr:glycine--tRNA ligase subunit beta [Glacieibacterium frigidum]TRW18304.1 glycine--tRNA ligase subunit beta [Glacieibacterium frigidum]
MPDFLLELLTEEIPARMQPRAAAQLRERFEAGIAGKLPVASVETHVTPRRLILIAYGLAAEGTATEEERRGPRADAPAQAIEGFVRSTGLPRESLEERDTPKGKFLYATIRAPGRPAADVLAELIPAIVRDFDWPKSMRWGDASVTTASPRWVRPLSGIVALLDETVVPFEAAGVTSGRTTRGHRFMHRAPVEISSAASYAGQLRDAHVVIDAAERAAIIAEGARAAATAAGLTLIEDAGLIAENAGLTEWPVPLLGRFDAAFLDVPREVIQLTMRTNQKYFACADGQGALAPAFVCVAGLAAPDGGAAIVAGNEKVLAARLSDAKFFWDADLKVPLADRLPKLESIVFHEKLGTVADKVERVAKLARWLVESGAVPPSPSPVMLANASTHGGANTDGGAGTTMGASVRQHDEVSVSHLADLAEQAARLCKADLVSATVGEFPEVQGIAGRYLALAEGLDPQVADAIRDHYKPVGPSDNVPTAPVSVAVALADKLDTLAAFYTILEVPTGSRDPYALRRAALGILRIIVRNGIRISLFDGAEITFQSVVETLIKKFHGYFIEFEPTLTLTRVTSADQALDDFSWFFELPFDSPGFQEPRSVDHAEAYAFVHLRPRTQILSLFYDFLADRLKVQQREAGIRPDIIDAVFALGGEDDLVRLLARVRALQAFIDTDDGANLLAGYRRAANILRIEEAKGEAFAAAPDPALLAVPAERALADALTTTLAAATDAVTREAFEEAMTALSRLRAPVDAFFDAVMVNDPDAAVRANRLNLLASFRAAVHNVADFSKIEG